MMHPELHRFTVVRMAACNAWSEMATQQITPSCRPGPGCGKCCHLIVLSSFCEAAAIVAAGVDVSKAVEQGKRQWSMIATAPGKTVAQRMRAACLAWTDLGEPCPFLADGLCTIYPIRPSSCATCWVTSDPAHCGTASETRQIVNADPMRYTIDLDTETRRKMGIGGPSVQLPLGVAIHQVQVMTAKGLKIGEHSLI